MEKYYKEIDGKVVVKNRNEVVLKFKKTIKAKDGREKEVTAQVINPKHEQLLEHGWQVYTIPEATAEDLLKKAKRGKVQEILAYDQSNEVNEFTISGFPVWLDKATRAGLMLRFQSEEALGKDVTTLWYNNQYFELPLSTAKAMLYQIEAYASECYDNTQKHLAQVARLTTIEEVEAYDYRSGYPDKLTF